MAESLFTLLWTYSELAGILHRLPASSPPFTQGDDYPYNEDSYETVRRQLSCPVRVNYDGRLGADTTDCV